MYTIEEIHEDEDQLEIVLINPGDPGDIIRTRFQRVVEQPEP